MIKRLSGAIPILVLGAFAGGWFLADSVSRPEAPVAIPESQVAPLDQLSRTYAAVARRVRPSVVYVESAVRAAAAEPLPFAVPPEFEPFFRVPRGAEVRRSSGSGFVVSADGYLITNAHVVARAEKVRVRLLDHREFDARIVGTDPATDIAVIKINASGLQPAPLGNSDSVEVGEWVLAVGNPLGRELSFTVTGGILSAKGRTLDLPNRNERTIQNFLQTDAAINPGNSGGPLVNVRGEVIGVNAAIASATGLYSGYGFAIPVNLTRRVMEQLIKTGRVSRTALGIRVRDATAEDAEYVGLQRILGVLIQDVGDSNSAAARAGLRQGDVIVAVDGKPVEYTGMLQEMVGFRKAGDVASVEVARKGGRRVTLRIVLQPVESGSGAEPAIMPERDDSAGAALVRSLGLAVQPISAEEAGSFGLPRGTRGLLVTAVDPEGPCADQIASPDSGPDVILAVEGQPVPSAADLRSRLSREKPGTVVELRVFNASSKTTRIERVRVSAR